MNGFARLCAGQIAFSSRLMFSFACQKRTRNPSRAGGAGDVFLSVKRLALRAGQRQGGVFRLPPPYLWTPLSPQRVKGCSPLTIPKKKSKRKKASRCAKTGCGSQRLLRYRSHPADRGPNSSSLYPPQAAVVAVALFSRFSDLLLRSWCYLSASGPAERLRRRCRE